MNSTSSDESASGPPATGGRTAWLVERLVRYRWLLLLLALVLAAISWWPAGNVEFDRSIENMFGERDPLLPPYERLKQRFGGNEIVMAVYRDPNLLAADGQGLDRLEQISERLRQVEGVEDVLSLFELNETLTSIQKLNVLRIFASRKPIVLDSENALGMRFRELFQGYTHDSTETIASVVCMLKPESESGNVSRRQTIDELRRIMEQLPGDLRSGMIAGEPVMVVDGFAYLEEDGVRLGLWSTLLLSLTIVICFRSLRWVAIPVLVVQLSLLLTRSLLVALGLRLSMVSSMMTAIVTVVGVATVVHLIVRFREARGQGLAPREALIRAGVLLAAPIAWACLTDAVGFASLLVAAVGPVRDFGVMMALGSLMVLISVGLLVPGLALFGSLDRDPRRAWGERALAWMLDRLIRWVDRRPKSLAAALVLVLLMSLGGLWSLEVETDFTKNFRQGSPIVRSYEFVEDHLGGAGVWDIVLPMPAGWPRDYLERVQALEKELRQLEIPNPRGEPARLSKVISLVDAIEAAAADPVLRRLPVAVRVSGMARTMPTFTAALVTQGEADESRYLRIMLRARERQEASTKLALIEAVQASVEKHFPATADEPAAEVTGFYVLLTNLIKSMVRDQWVCFAVASAGIALMLLLAFSSFKLALIALVPNALPILMVLGSMGWLGLKINMGAAMIAAVSMGLSVDSSIHYLAAFRRERAAGKSLFVALADVQQTVGLAAVFSTLALIVGFSTLCSSQFVPTIYFGGLVSLSMLGGLAGNLIVLPLLLKLGASKA